MTRIGIIAIIVGIIGILGVMIFRLIPLLSLNIVTFFIFIIFIGIVITFVSIILNNMKEKQKKKLEQKNESFKEDKRPWYLQLLKLSQIKISQKSIALAPKNIDLEHSAAIPQAANTSLLALRNIASLRKGHKLLINGASGGVGTIALQIASIYEAETTAVTSYRNIDWIKEEFKPQNIIDYAKEDFTNLNEKYDVIFDANGNKSFPDVEKCLNSNGVYVTTKNNIYNQIDFIKQFVKNKKSRVVLSAKSTTSSLDMFRMWVEDGKLKPIIEKIYSFDQFSEAYAHLAEGRTKGKIILNINWGERYEWNI